MATVARKDEATIDGVDVAAYKVPTATEQESDPAPLELVRAMAGPNVELMADGNGAYSVQEALLWAESFRKQGVTYFEEPLSSEDLHPLAEVRGRAPAGLAIVVGEYGWNLPYFQRMLDAGSVHILQADVTRCGGITNLLRIDGRVRARTLPFSAHCTQAVSVHACCAMKTVIHIEYLFEHYRIGTLFDGTLDPSQGRLIPDRSRAGHGLELKREESERYRVSTGGDT